ncbi:hypothetical protein AMELA_G00289160 [Ameiurus melas]|uniref:Uncharacterized protein n=1 Tax=Ameiurus melas TaxID=219545 RepID=A0A7J5ZKB6_AMEME|nr:hypothetical protein AMELA_G00289160 [Ameiurus melas]
MSMELGYLTDGCLFFPMLKVLRFPPPVQTHAWVYPALCPRLPEMGSRFPVTLKDKWYRRWRDGYHFTDIIEKYVTGLSDIVLKIKNTL